MTQAMADRGGLDGSRLQWRRSKKCNGCNGCNGAKTVVLVREGKRAEGRGQRAEMVVVQEGAEKLGCGRDDQGQDWIWKQVLAGRGTGRRAISCLPVPSLHNARKEQPMQGGRSQSAPSEQDASHSSASLVGLLLLPRNTHGANSLDALAGWLQMLIPGCCSTGDALSCSSTPVERPSSSPAVVAIALHQRDLTQPPATARTTRNLKQARRLP